uniref:Uncharacterized protein n=1 Tax=Anguilla anguilla TaxID=7936 RepID=A0A0E9RCA4_ANGAN
MESKMNNSLENYTTYVYFINIEFILKGCPQLLDGSFGYQGSRLSLLSH